MRPDLRSFFTISLMFCLWIAPAAGQGQSGGDRGVQPLVPPDVLSVEGAARHTQQLLHALTPVAGIISPVGGTIMGKVASFGDFATVGALADAAHALNQTMASFEPDYSPNGMPGIPVSCNTTGDGQNLDVGRSCTACYRNATRQIDVVRVDFERLRAVGSRTKVFVDAALAFGDSYSTVAGNGSLGWSKSRTDVIASWDQFKLRYETSYRSLLAKLNTGLRALDTCEDTYFDNPDWYNRQGFIFFAFMEARYQLE